MIDELQRVKNFRGAEPPPSTKAERAARAALARAIAAELKPESRQARWRRMPRFGALACAAGAVAATVVLLSVFGSGGSPTGASPAAAAVLQRLAHLIAAQSLTPRPGQYLYVDTRAAYPTIAGATNCETIAVQHRQIWIGADSSGLLRGTFGPAHYTSAAARAACLRIPARGRPPVGPGSRISSDTWFAAHCLTLGPTNNWNGLSSNPRVLLRQMRRIDGGPPTPAEDFVHIGDFLRETDAPPRVRAAIYKAAALIPGVRLLGWVRDHDGRRGLGVTFTASNPKLFPRLPSNSELIFDARTGELLGEQGTGYWAVYLHERIVNRLPSQPPAFRGCQLDVTR